MPNVYTFCQGSALSRKRGRTNLGIEARNDLARRHREGESAAALARAFGISERHAYRIASRNQRAAERAARQVVVTFRAEAEEVAAFMEAASAAGLATRSQAMRALVRMAGGFFEVLPGEFEPLREAAWVTGRCGVLLNQIARNTHRGQLRLTDEDRRLLRTAIDTVGGVESTLRGIVEGVRTRRGYMAAVALAEETARSPPE
jgi:hypothetical protein